MTRAAAGAGAVVALALAACSSASRDAGAPAPIAAADVVCASGRDRDHDGLTDACELAFARAFAPVLLQDPADCGWSDDVDRIAGGYAHAVQPAGAGRVRIAYLPAYARDCGWDGAKCLLPGVNCAGHAGDSEALVVEVHDSAGWRPRAVFLSAHCFDGAARDCRWYGGAELERFRWSGSRPFVWVAAGRHANYASRRACDRGHHFLDSCDFEPRRVDFPVVAERNIGSAAAPLAREGCLPPPAADHRVGAYSLECLWQDVPFRGWQPTAAGVTPYRRYLDRVAGFVQPIDRLVWLAGCWERRGDAASLEEQWMAPRGGTMLGMSRTVRAGRTVEHEAMRIEQRGDTLFFVANPSGQAPAEFAAASVADDVVVFENPAHDFPQRIVYRHAAGDSLHARIEGLRDGAERGIDFRMGRTECGS